jgi:4-azaleucine resistance transporter AzlC
MIATVGHQREDTAVEIAETEAGFRVGLRAGLPLAVAGLVDGLVFGALARQAGLTPAEATLMSSLVCAGTAQFLAIGLWGSPLPVVSILATTLGVNLRHLLMGATLQPRLGRSPRRCLYPILYFLSDESWALATRELERGKVRETFLFGSGAILTAGWVGSTFVGATAGQAIRDPARWGLDFTFVAIFAALLAGLWPGRQRALPWVVAAATAIAADWALPPGWHVLAGGVAGTIVGVVQRDD